MKKRNGWLIAAAVIVIGIGTGIFLFARFNYNSPIKEAGRDYKSRVESYKNEPILSMDDVYERMELLRDHFHSPTFDKMRNSPKTEVTLEDIETLFGEADEVIQDVPIDYNRTVYQYKYGDETLNIHQGWSGMMEEYVFEEYLGELYDSQELDDLFFETVHFHQSNYRMEEDQWKLLPETELSKQFPHRKATREVSQSGWYQWPGAREKYFDDGNAQYSPEEFVLMVMEDNDEKDAKSAKVTRIERRYRKSFTELSKEELEEKQTIYFEWAHRFEELGEEKSEETVTVQDLSNDFGEMTNLMYTLSDGGLNVYWVMIDDEENILLVNGKVADMPGNMPLSKEELDEKELIEIDYEWRLTTTPLMQTNRFIGQ